MQTRQTKEVNVFRGGLDNCCIYDVDVGSEKVSPVLFVRSVAKKGTSRGHHRHRERG